MTNVSKRDVHENGCIYSYKKSRLHLLIWRQNVGMGLSAHFQSVIDVGIYVCVIAKRIFNDSAMLFFFLPTDFLPGRYTNC